MKKSMMYVLGLLFITSMLSSCNQQKSESVNTLLANSEKQDEIMTAISSNHTMMDNMMNHIMQSPHAMQMMQMNEGMMKKMMQGDQSMNMMEKNPEIMTSMMNKMMEKADSDSVLCKQMTEMMMNHPNMMKMMNDKVNSSNGDHSNHH